MGRRIARASDGVADNNTGLRRLTKETNTVRKPSRQSVTVDPPPSPWRCPLCQMPLRFGDGHYRCTHGHVFDRAKEGYVNLLPSHRKHSAEPGDARQMLASRREFLQRGYYQVLAERLAELCAAHYAEAPFHLLDIGCGEGYYTGRVAACLDVRGGARVAGIDISKPAARMAAKRYPQVAFAVASNADIPLADGWADCVLRVFAPGYAAETRRVMKPGAMLLAVTPGPRHLYGLRQLIYDRATPHRVASAAMDGLTHVRREALDAWIELDNAADSKRLLAMTPYYWQASAEQQQRVAALRCWRLEIEFCIDIYRRE
jgi:23S rRNA (guanine745-N1)-methyltransferase